MRFSLLVILTLFSVLLNAQAPALIPYQAVARDAAGQALNNAAINARFTIHDGEASGAVAWQEIQTVTTSELGLFTVQLGSSIALTGVDWSNGTKFMQVEIDLGQGFVDMGTQQLLSVPYALFSSNAQNAEHSGNGFSHVSLTGDTLYFQNDAFVIIPGISAANNSGGGGTTTGTTLHTCGAPNVHNPDLNYGSMTDQEGNVYKTIVIGTQEWMAENLNTRIYRNGDAIPTNLDNATWQATTNGAWAYFNNAASYSCPYGKLYNWYACVDTRQLCPAGWHVPTDEEWSILTGYLGGGSVAGGKMKTTGTIETATGMWTTANTPATNNSGFSGSPGGLRDYYGYYYDIGYYGSWWSTSEYEIDYARNCYLSYGSDDAISGGNYKQTGFSVRCLRD
jgi:uncharacterized protein (TIGR02145 family)